MILGLNDATSSFELFLKSIQTAGETLVGGAVESRRRWDDVSEPVIRLEALFNAHSDHWNHFLQRYIRFCFAVSTDNNNNAVIFVIVIQYPSTFEADYIYSYSYIDCRYEWE